MRREREECWLGAGADEVPRRDFDVLVDFEDVSFGMFPLHALADEIHSPAFVGHPKSANKTSRLNPERTPSCDRM